MIIVPRPKSIISSLGVLGSLGVHCLVKGGGYTVDPPDYFRLTNRLALMSLLVLQDTGFRIAMRKKLK